MTTATLPEPEIRPATDEKRPDIGPNLAMDEKLCKAVTKLIVDEYWFAYRELQYPFWNTWRKIDNMWRARGSVQDLNLPHLTRQSVEASKPTEIDGKSAKGQSVKPFQQIHAITDIMEQISWEDGLPARAEAPEGTVEDDFYQPTDQSCRAANSLLNKNARKINLRDSYRRSAGCFGKYGLAWALTDFRMTYHKVELQFPISDEAQAMSVLEKYPTATIVPGMAVAQELRVKDMLTDFYPLAVDDVFFDPLISCEPVENQPCPIVRRHTTVAAIRQNQYHPVNNPFGFVNVEFAIQNQKGHYALSEENEAPLREKLRNRYNINDQMGGGRRVERIRQRWTCFPLLGIIQNANGEFELDSGEGVTCPHCEGRKFMFTEQGDADCPTCQASGKVFPPLKRYMVDLYGSINSGSTCLRIQELPEGMELPLLYAADLIEDESCSLPMSKSEIAMIAVDQLTTSETQFVDSKNNTIYRGWQAKEDSPAAKIQNPNAPNARVLFESHPDEFKRLDTSSFDDSTTLIPYIQRLEAQVEQIFGVTPTLQGLLAAGRRSALEVGEATEAAKNPLVLMTDRFNRAFMGGWARKSIKNAQLFGDRDYIRRITGREFFGEIDIFTAVGKEFFQKLAATANLRYILESSANDPSMMGVRPAIWNELLPLMGITNVRVPDGGMQKAQDDAMRIITQILGDGQMVPPSQDDPHEIYLMAFKGALKDPYWQTRAPQNLPLLQQRIMWQTQLQIQQEMLQMQQQLLQNQMMNPQPEGNEGGTGNEQSAPGQSPESAGQLMQHAQG